MGWRTAKTSGVLELGAFVGASSPRSRCQDEIKAARDLSGKTALEDQEGVGFGGEPLDRKAGLAAVKGGKEEKSLGQQHNSDDLGPANGE